MIKLLIVDDSALFRRVLADLFEAEGDVELQFARDGVEALERLQSFQPDVITLDLQMPRLDGLSCLDRIMVERPTPVVVFSAVSAEGADETLQAFELGAVEAAQKPAGAVTLQIDRFGADLVRKVRTAAGARIRRTHRLADRVRARSGGVPTRRVPRAVSVGPQTTPAAKARADAGPATGCVLVGSSTGGPPALDVVLSALPADFPWAVLVAQHMPAAFTGPLARRLDSFCAVNVTEVTGLTPLQAGTVYVGRGETDLTVGHRAGGPVALAAPASAAYTWHPSVDRLVESAMGVFPPDRLVGVLLTGMGDDGASAMTRLRQAGGRTIAEAEATAVVWGMPGALVRAGGAEFVEPVDGVARRLLELARVP